MWCRGACTVNNLTQSNCCVMCYRLSISLWMIIRLLSCTLNTVGYKKHDLADGQNFRSENNTFSLRFFRLCSDGIKCKLFKVTGVTLSKKSNFRRHYSVLQKGVASVGGCVCCLIPANEHYAYRAPFKI